MNPLALIDKYYAEFPEAKKFLLEHSHSVAEKAIEAARRVEHLKPDMDFVREAAMLHDIAIFMTNAKRLGCKGDKPYICHGYLGRELLEREGLPRHALVAERHVGVGLTVEDIRAKGFPIPERDMTPRTLEEKIVCFADKFFSKDDEPLKEKPVEKVRLFIGAFGADKLAIFDEWLRFFGYARKT